MAMNSSGKRARLLTGCAMAAAMTGQAHAQSYPDRSLQGSSTTVSGNVSISRSPTIDRITVSSPQAIINWNPETGQPLPAGPIDFLPTGKTASFESGYGTPTFTVLNRVLPSDQTRPISFNGTVSSTSGGSVWFYSPGGIIAGPTAVFNVGNLVLTSSDIDTTGGLFGSNSEIRFRGIAGSNSKIDIQAGAKINLLNTGSYLAVVAPRVSQSGDVKTNGSAGYIAAESADVRINSGLFDINFVSGTSASGQVLDHTGTTTSDSGNYANNGIFFAAMPKNQAISMLLGGTVGYTPAATATVENGVIVLAAGTDIVGGGPDLKYTEPKLASITITGGTYRSSVTASATDKTTIKPATGQTANFAGSVSLRGLDLAVDATNASILVGGNLDLNASALLQGGVASLSASNGGVIDAGGYIQVSADGKYNFYDPQSAPTDGDNVRGGTVSLNINNGRISTPGTLALSAYAEGGTGNYSGRIAGSGRGGLATIDVRNSSVNNGLRSNSLFVNVAGETGYGTGGSGVGGTIQMTASNAALQATTQLDLLATGGAGRSSGGSGTGGTIGFSLDGVTTDLVNLSVFADGSGGQASANGLNGGSGTGGTITVGLRGITESLTSLNVSASGTGVSASGTGGRGGIATGGDVSFALDNSTLSAANGLILTSNAFGGFGDQGNGASATAGRARVDLINGAAFSGNVQVEARADGGASYYNTDPNEDGVSDAFGTAGSATGGNILLTVDNGTINAPNYVELVAQARGGVGPVGGNATGGTIDINVPNGAIVSPSQPQSGVFTADASAQGGTTQLREGDPRVATARMGNATGGAITLVMGRGDGTGNGLLAFDTVRLNARGYMDDDVGPDVGQQSDVRGGTINATLLNSTLNAFSGLDLDASATAGFGVSSYGGGDVVSGGNAFGGTVRLTSTDSFINASVLRLLSTATAGEGIGSGYESGYGDFMRESARGGSAQGGTSILTASGGGISGSVRVDAIASGGNGGDGDGANGASGGAAVGGTATASLSFTQVAGPIGVFSTADGGRGGRALACEVNCDVTPPFGAGNGGSATGGDASLDIVGGGGFSLDSVRVSSSANGGEGGYVDSENFGATLGTPRGGRGGDATAGDVHFGITLTAAENSFSSIDLLSEAFGGDGGTGQLGGQGGNATGGAIDFEVLGGAYGPNDLRLSSRAIGGEGGASAFGTGAAGGNATAGDISLRIAGANTSFDLPVEGEVNSLLDASATGGFGANSQADGGSGGAGGNATAGKVELIADGASINGNDFALSVDISATAGAGAEGTAGADGGGAGGIGGRGGDAIGGTLSFTALLGGQITLPALDLDLRTVSGDGGQGGQGGQGTTGMAGMNGGAGQNGGAGGTGGIGGAGGRGGRGGNAVGSEFTATSTDGSTIAFSALDINVSATAGQAGFGGDGGMGGTGGRGGTGGNANVTFPNPGAGGMGGTGGTGGVAGNGGDGGDAKGGTFLLTATNGTITADNLTVRANGAASFGAVYGNMGSGGLGGEGGYGGTGAQTTGATGATGNQGNSGSCTDFTTQCQFGMVGQTQGGLISLSALTNGFGNTPGSLMTGATDLRAFGVLSGGEDGYGNIDGYETGQQGEIRIAANGSGTLLSFNGLDAYAGGIEDNGFSFGFGGIIDITGSDTTLDFNNTRLTSSGGVSVLLDGSATIASGEIFNANASAITIAHNGLAPEGATITADEIHLSATSSIDTTSSLLEGFDLVELRSAYYLTIGNARSRTILADSGHNPFFGEEPPHFGDLTANGLLEATNLISLRATNDISVVSGADLRSDNQINIFAGGDVTIEGGASVAAALDPEQGYGQFDPFDQNGSLNIAAGLPARDFAITPGDIASVRIAGTLEALQGAISIRGQAIDGTGSTISAKYFRADTFDYTDSGNNDFGRLGANCTEGNICLGSIDAPSIFAIGSLGAPIKATIAQVLTSDVFTVEALGDIRIGDGTSSFTFGGSSVFTLTSQTGDINLDGPITAKGDGDATLLAGGAVFGPAATLMSQNATVTAPGGITLAGLDVTGLTTLTSPAGTIDVSGIRAGTVNARGSAISLRGPGNFNSNSLVATGTAINVDFDGNINIDAATAAGALGIFSDGGNVTIGTIGTAQSRPTNLDVQAFNNITIGDASAVSSVNLTAGSLLTVNGTLLADLIRLRSADIAIGGNARLGNVGATSQLNIVSSATTTTVGGSLTGAGYRLSEAELQRVSANNVLVSTRPIDRNDEAIDPNATPTLTLDTLSLSAAQGQQGLANLANTGTLRFETQGTMRVTGAVRLTGAATGNRLELAAGPAIQVRPGGSASLVNGTDLQGTLFLSAADIIASDATTLTGLSTAATPAAQSALLDINPGTTDDTGFFAANTIEANVARGLYVQNTGASQQPGAKTYDQRRGLTAGSGGLKVTPTDERPITVVINGRQVSTTTTGGFITGLDFIPLVNLTTNNTVSGSTINGCVIGTTCSVIVNPPPPLNLGIDPGIIARDTIDSLIEDELDAMTNSANTPDVLIELPQFTSLVGQPLIEDPVTGSGNDDLLADKDGKQCDPSVETCTKE